MPVTPIPAWPQNVVPYLVVDSVPKLIDFLKATFRAEELGERTVTPDGRVMHAAVRIGDSMVMMGEASEQYSAMRANLYVYVDDTDAAYARAMAAGARSLREPADQFYGDRNAGVEDSQGNFWWIGTHVEDVDPEEMKRREEAAFQKHG